MPQKGRIRKKEMYPIHFDIRKDTRMGPDSNPEELPKSQFYENIRELGLTVEALAIRVSLLTK